MKSGIEGIPHYIRTPKPSYEAREYSRRGGKPYSIGHRRMYSAPIEMLKGKPDLSILEIGMGVGYGLNQMMRAGFIRQYFGVEPDAESFSMAVAVSQQYPHQDFTFWNRGWLDLAKEEPKAIPVCDYTFCIEVIEHVRPQDIPDFLSEIRIRTRHALFLSTPDAITSTHGVASRDEWRKVLQSVGYRVASIARQWTTLYICET